MVIMSLFSMNNSSEHELHVNFFSEAFSLYGNDCLLYQIEHKQRDLQHDPHIVYQDPIPMCICFESNPKPILKRLNWFTEDDDLAYIAYIAFKDKHLEDVEIRSDCLIEVLSRTKDVDSTHKFIITKVTGNKINPLFWTIKLAPYRPDDGIDDSVDPDSDHNTTTGYYFVKRDNATS